MRRDRILQQLSEETYKRHSGENGPVRSFYEMIAMMVYIHFSFLLPRSKLLQKKEYNKHKKLFVFFDFKCCASEKRCLFFVSAVPKTRKS